MEPAPHADLKTALRVLARRQGFLDCRVAPALPTPHAARLIAWLGEGRAGDMTWLDTTAAARLDPRRVLPGARSVLVLAMNYWQGNDTTARPTGAGAGRIARHAWGDDYHQVIRRRLGPLTRLLVEHGGTQRCFVDTGPILETGYADRAGLGWKGKHNLIVHPTAAGWILLGTILTTLDIEPDPPLAARCGRCTRCIDACPTGAILGPHDINPRRCIAYLTIELRGPIPPELRARVGNRIFGCDSCLEACPWNRFASVSREAVFGLRPAFATLSLRDILDLDPAAFALLARRSPLGRLGRARLRRNACVALGNVGGEDDIDALRRAAADPDPVVAEHAAWAVESIAARAGVTQRNGQKIGMSQVDSAQ